MLDSITIKNFKAIQDKEIPNDYYEPGDYCNLSSKKHLRPKPLTLNKLAPVNYLVGPNGCGKSSVLEGVLSLTSDGTFRTYSYEGTRIEIELNNGQKYELYFDDSAPNKIKHTPDKNIGLRNLPLVHDKNSLQDGNNLFSHLSQGLVNITQFNTPDKREESERLLDTLNQLLKSLDLNQLVPTHKADDYSYDRWIYEEGGDKNRKVLPINLAGGVKQLYVFEQELRTLIQVRQSQQKNGLNLLIEEPEFQLHPQYQKQLPALFDRLRRDYPDLQFFISTHSPFIVNAALEQNEEGKEPVHKVYRLEGGECVGEYPSTESKHLTFFNGVAAGLGVQPSDLLFANGVVWVEGPTDILYLRKWLQLFQKEKEKIDKRFVVYKEGKHFSFQCLATATWGYTTLEDLESKNYLESVNEVINLATLSRRNLIVLDKDTDIEVDQNGRVNILQSKCHYQGQNKKNLIDRLEAKEISKTPRAENTFWINDGTIETYLKDFVATKNGKRLKINLIEGESKDKNKKYGYQVIQGDKSVNAKKIFQDDQLDFEDFAPHTNPKTDLRKKIQALYNTIASWNQSTP